MGGNNIKKINSMALMIGCFLILSNLSITVSAVDFSVSTNNVLTNLNSELEDNYNIIQPEEEIFVEEIVNNNEFVIEEEVVTEEFVQIDHHKHQVVYGNANAGGPYFAKKGESLSFSAAGTKHVSGIVYKWDFGDDSNRATGCGLNPTHTYRKEGVYYTTLKVIRPNGDVFLDVALVYIDQVGTNLVPYGGCSYEAEIDQEIVFDASGSIGLPGADLEFRWDFGDGNGFTDWSDNPKIAYSYEKERIYLVDLEVKDQFGNVRRDILHADIGTCFSSVEDLFIFGDGLFAGILDVFFEDLGIGDNFCELFDVKIFTKYNDIIKVTPIVDFKDQKGKQIDVNDDGSFDVNIGDISWFRLASDSPRSSPFNSEIRSYQFETTLSNVQVLPSGSVKTDDDFTICLQFTFPDFISGNEIFGLAEPTIRIGYRMEAGEDKSGEQISVTHVFRPFFLAKFGLLGSGSNENYVFEKESQGYNVFNGYVSDPVIYPYSVVCLGDGGVVPATAGSFFDLSIEEEYMSVQPKSSMMPMVNSGVFPEHGMVLEGLDGETVSIVAIVENDEYVTSLDIRFEEVFSPFVITHRRGDVCRDVDLSGSDDSSVVLSVSRLVKSIQKSATLGLLIEPMDDTSFSIDIGRDNVERYVTFNIFNPPGNIVLFSETEDAQGEVDGRYIYLKNIPNMIEFRWLPRLLNGYFTLEHDVSSESFEIGICDNLTSPESKLFVDDVPQIMGLNWSVSFEEVRSFEIVSSTTGLSLNAWSRKLVGEVEQILSFEVTSVEGVDLLFLWNVFDGYFELERSMGSIDFELLFLQGPHRIFIGGGLNGADKGFVVDLNGLESGSIFVENEVSLDGVLVNMSNDDSGSFISFVADFNNYGSMVVSWDEKINFSIDINNEISFTNFKLDTPKGVVLADEFFLTGNSGFELVLSENSKLEFIASGNVAVTNFDADVGQWTGFIGSAGAGGGFKVVMQPKSKFYKLKSSSSFTLDGFHVTYDKSGSEEYDLDFVIDDFEYLSGGIIWFNFSSDKPRFNFDSNDLIGLAYLSLNVGGSSDGAIDFSISNTELLNDGVVYAEINSEYLLVDAAIDLYWDVDIETKNFGNWELVGDISGDGTITLNEWTPGLSGDLEFNITDTISLDMYIAHDDLKLEFGPLTLNAGIINYNWKRENESNGYLNILNSGVNGSFNVFKITILGTESPVELMLGNISVEPGNIYVDWSRKGALKYFHIENYASFNLGLLKFIWDIGTSDEKMVSVGSVGMTPGEFKFLWDISSKKIEIKNGINRFGPVCTFEDDDRKVSVDLLNLYDDYSKTFTFQWYEDGGDRVNGVYVDTDNIDIVDWFEFTSIRFNSSGDTGRRLSLEGFKADDFCIRTNGNLNISGKLFFGDNITFSRLTDPANGTWESLNIQWELKFGSGELKWIKFDSDFDLVLDLGSVEIIDFTFVASLDLADYFEVKWHLDPRPLYFSEVHLDSNNQKLSSINLEITGPYNNLAVKIVGGGVYSNDWYVSWRPGEKYTYGTIGYNFFDLYAKLVGGEWVHIWPV